MPRVHCVTRSCTKLTMIRGENCMEASVRVMSMMAKTMETTVMMEAAMPARMICATCGSAREGNSTPGVQPRRAGKDSSNAESTAPARSTVGAPGTRHAGCTWPGGTVMAGVMASSQYRISIATGPDALRSRQSLHYYGHHLLESRGAGSARLSRSHRPGIHRGPRQADPLLSPGGCHQQPQLRRGEHGRARVLRFPGHLLLRMGAAALGPVSLAGQALGHLGLRLRLLRPVLLLEPPLGAHRRGVLGVARGASPE